MHRSRSSQRPPTLRALTAAVAIGASLVLVPLGSSAVADPPPNPSDQQLQSAAAQKAAVAGEVGQLNADIASIQQQIQQKKAVAELAEQKYAYAMQKLDEANAAAAAAKKNLGAAQAKVRTAQANFQSYVQDAYMGGEVAGTTGSLLTAQDPSVVLEQGALQQYESEHQLNTLDQLQTATVGVSNAEARSRAAVQQAAQAKKDADEAKQAAEDALAAAQQQQQQLQTELGAKQAELQQKQEALATLNHERAQFIAYQQHQAYLRHLAYLKHQAELAAARRRAAELAAEAARAAAERRRHHQGGSGGGGGGGGGTGGGGGGNPAPPPPQGGGWTSAKGYAAVSRARQYLGWMYAWAGGNAYGPTRGVCAGDGAWNDCNVIGFDCSGLSLFAWAPYERLDHYTVTQYFQAGSYHPSIGDLRAGDLVFWSSNGSPSGIHHVAIYEGNGMVIQAPQSGEVIQETPLGSVDWGYYGATRPLS